MVTCGVSVDMRSDGAPAGAVLRPLQARNTVEPLTHSRNTPRPPRPAGWTHPHPSAPKHHRHYKAAALQFAEASGYAVTCTADGKGFFPEDHPQFIGTYFKSFSDPASISDAVASSDALVFLGVHFNEFTWPHVPDNATHERSVILYKSRAVLALGHAYLVR